MFFNMITKKITYTKCNFIFIFYHIFLYNYIRGQLVNIPDVDGGAIYVSLYSGSSGPQDGPLFLPNSDPAAVDGDTKALGGHVETGIYSASVAFSSSSITTVYPVWHNGGDPEVVYYSGSGITVKSLDGANNYPIKDFVTNISFEKNLMFFTHVFFSYFWNIGF